MLKEADYKGLVEAFSEKARQEIPGAKAFRTPLVEFYIGRTFAGAAHLHCNKVTFNLDNSKAIVDTVETIAHEVAHCLAWYVHGNGVKPHGPEWKSLMSALGYPNARATFNGETELGQVTAANRNIKRQRRWEYECVGCAEIYSIATVTHNRMQKGQHRICNKCRNPIQFTGKELNRYQ